jgi:magnesium-transporting ATPase (P-type)
MQAGAFDRFLNIEITVLILVQAALCVGMAIGSVQWRSAHRSHWYFEWREHTGNNYASDVVYGIFNFLTFWCALLTRCLGVLAHRRGVDASVVKLGFACRVLFSYLVPISLFVSVEIVKFMQVRAATAVAVGVTDADACAICHGCPSFCIICSSLPQGAIFVNRDQRMRDPVTREYALARNTNLNEVRCGQHALALLCRASIASR